jgi:hypothetical protein
MFISIDQRNVGAKLILNVAILDKDFMYVDIRYVGVNRLLFLIKHLSLIEMWSVKDQEQTPYKHMFTKD